MNTYVIAYTHGLGGWPAHGRGFVKAKMGEWFPYLIFFIKVKRVGCTYTF